MTYIVLTIIGLAVVIGTFIWINRNKPEILDAVEDKVRNFKK